MSTTTAWLKVVIGGVLGLILTLGIARFAYSAILPIMLKSGVIDNGQGAWLTTVNYLGYFCGALMVASLSDMRLKSQLFRAGLIIAVLSTLMMAFTNSMLTWMILRFIAGLSSAAGLLIGSGLVLHWLMRHHYRSELGIPLSGLGLGIVITTLQVEWFSTSTDWQQQWLYLAALAVLLAIPAWAWVPQANNEQATVTGEKLVDRPPGRRFLRWFMAAYFCAGIGFVVNATFIVALIRQQPDIASYANYIFVLIGLFAIPACFIWDLIARKIGNMNALILAFTAQTVGMFLPVYSMSLTSNLLSAASFGFTFIGIVSLVLGMAGRYYPSKPAKMMGKMTLSYSLAQIAAPALIAISPGIERGYMTGIWIAAIAMLVGTLILILARNLHQDTQANTQH